MLSFSVQLTNGNHGYTKKRMNHIPLILDFKALIFLCNCSYPHILPCFQFIVVYMFYVFLKGAMVGSLLCAKIRKIIVLLP